MIQQLAAWVDLKSPGGPYPPTDDEHVFIDLAAILDGVPELANLSLQDRRAAAAKIMFALSFGDPNDDSVPGGPHIIRRQAEWILTEDGAAPLADPQSVSAALHATADAIELADLTRSQR